jgi:hypothetical protein
MKYFFVFFIQSFFCFSQNLVFVEDDIEIQQNESFSIPLKIQSDGSFTAFQFDLNFNSQAFEFVNTNLETSELNNHSITVSELDSDTIRIIVFSNQNSIIEQGVLEVVSIVFNSKDLIGDFSFVFSEIVSDAESLIASPFSVTILPQTVFFDLSGGIINKISPLSVSVDLINQSPIKAIQFDMVLPSNFTADLSSVVKFNRLLNHELAIENISNNTYRLIIYSTQNSLISIGNDSIFEFQLNTTETLPGSYDIQLDNFEVIGSDNQIIPPFFNSQNIIIEPNSLQIIDQVDLGEISLNEIKQFSIQINNNENLPHQINQINNPYFDYFIPLPLQINPQSSSEITFQFTPDYLGTIHETISFFHSGNESVSEVTVTAEVVSYNYFYTINDVLDISDNFLNISLSTSSTSKAYQFDLDLPNGFSVDLDNIVLDELFSDLNLDVTQINSQKYRFLIYSNNNQFISSVNTNFISLPLVVSEEIQSNYYDVLFSNCIIVGDQNQDIYNSPTELFSFYYTINNLQESYFKITNINTAPGNLEILNLNLINNENVKAFQFDIYINNIFNFSTDDIYLTSRSLGFNISVSEISQDIFRFIVYSNNPNDLISAGDGSVIDIEFNVNSSAPPGIYYFNFENVTIVNQNNQDINTPPQEIGYVQVDNSLSLENSDSIYNYKVYPNPTNGIIYIDGKYREIANIKVFSILGKELFEIKSDFNKIHLNDIEKGIYILKIKTLKNNFYNIKIIKNQ